MRRTISERFWSKVDKRGPDECWPWIGYIKANGYGTIGGGRRGVILHVHRVAYALMVGPIPPGLDIDHLCRHRACVNPKHLEPVTRKENLHRGRHFLRERTHCPHGHSFSGENLHVLPNGARRCRMCDRASARSRYRARKGQP